MANNTAVRVPLTTELLSVEDRLREANTRKTEGNDNFRKGDWEEALSAYESAMNFLPKRKAISEDKQPESPTPEFNDGPSPDPETVTSDLAKSLQESLEEEAEKACASLRSVLNANIGACHVKLVSSSWAKQTHTQRIGEGEHKQAVEACTRALLDDPNYLKALQRRAASNEVLNTWSSLSSAQEDYNTLLKLLPSSSKSKDIHNKLVKLKPRLEMAQKHETAEMLDKLKTLGNSVLGNFGLSTDNFKFEPNGQGGYSVNFSR